MVLVLDDDLKSTFLQEVQMFELLGLVFKSHLNQWYMVVSHVTLALALLFALPN
jgi:hypothetical protein